MAMISLSRTSALSLESVRVRQRGRRLSGRRWFCSQLQGGGRRLTPPPPPPAAPGNLVRGSLSARLAGGKALFPREYSPAPLGTRRTVAFRRANGTSA